MKQNIQLQMDKTFKEVLAKFAAFVGACLVISLYFDDYSSYSPREVTQMVAHPGMPTILPKDSNQVMLQKMEKYADTVQHHCQDLRAEGLYKYKEGDTDAADNANLMVSNKYKFVVCKAAGIAGTNIHRLVYALENNIKDANTITRATASKQNSNLMLNSFSAKDKQKKLKQFTKFMVIRDPLERLLSAYRAELPANMWSGPVAPAFREYVATYLAAAHPMVPPWREVSKLCNPCEIQYDYIVPLSAFDKAIPAILSSVGAPNISVPTRELTNYKPKSSLEMAKLTYNANFPQQLKQRLQEKCKIDYYLFYGKRYFT